MVSMGNVMIFGDSYSTFEGYIPEGYATWYNTAAEHDEAHATDVNDVKQTWWKRLLNETSANLVRNESWSGSTICHTGYNGDDVSSWSFIARLEKLIDEKFFENVTIDTLFIFGGTNDSSANSPVGELQYADWTTQDLYQALPAFAYFLNRVKDTLPNTRVIWLVNTDLKNVIKDGIVAVCRHYDTECLCFHDIHKLTGHPSIRGMHEIKEQILEYLAKK